MPFDLPLLIRRRRSSNFSPASLFAASEPGGWYDPSDLTTLFQDSAGTTPVTAAGQSVGLWLDKSQGLVLGSELVSNPGGPFVATTGYSAGGSATISVSSGRLSVAQTVGFTDGVLCALPNNSFSNSSVITFEVDLGSATLVQVQAGNGNFGNGSIIVVNITASGTYNIVTTTRGGGTAGLTFKAGSAATFFLSRVSVKELPGNHLTQSTLSNRPQYQVDGNGRGYLQFDGSDDWLVSPTITPGIDKAQVFAGVRKLSDATRGMLVEFSAATASNNGSFHLEAPSSAGVDSFYWRSRGTILADVNAIGFAAPTTRVLTGLGDITGDVSRLRINGTQVGETLTDQGSGNYLAYPLYVGRRGGASLPLNGRVYSLIVRFGANLPLTTIQQVENWVANRTGIAI